MVSIDYNKLYMLVTCAIEQIEGLEAKQESSYALDSIKKQMEFIQKNAIYEKNPIEELKDGFHFTYGVLATRELQSPKELQLKSCIDNITKILARDDNA